MDNLRRLWWKIVGFGFRLLYNEMAFTYNLVSSAVSLGAWRCWQQAALPHLAGVSGWVLELAHGTGNLQLDLHDAGFQSIGYDLSPYMGRIASAKLRRAGQPVRLTCGMAQHLPFPDAAFGAVVSTFPTNFIIAPETLHEIHRVLRPDGHLVIVTNGILTGGDVISSGIEWLYRITGQRENRTAQPTLPESQDIDRYFAPAGFALEMHNVACPRSVAQIIVARKKV